MEPCEPCYKVAEEVEAFYIADPICTFVFSVLVCISVTPIVKKCVNVLMEGTPENVDVDELIDEIKALA